MSNYRSDFAPADGFYEPVEPIVFLEAAPLVLLAILILLALAFLAGMWFSRWNDTRDGRADRDPALDEIYRAILLASHAAMGASSHNLAARAHDLRATVDRLLGPVAVLGKGLNGALKPLDEAIKGEIKDDHAHGGGHPGEHGGHKPACGCGKRTGSCSCGGGGSGAAAVTVNQIVVTTNPVAVHEGHVDDHGQGHGQGHGHGGDHAASVHAVHKPETRKMTTGEQIDALGKSVRDFHDYWSNRIGRMEDLKAARAALLRRPPAADLKGTDSRVWNR